MSTAIALYQAGKVDKLLLTGDNSSLYYNEPGHMGEYARSQGVPESALAYDYAGRRTYDSCWRARHIFGQERVVLVTQDFHLPRRFTCASSLASMPSALPPTGVSMRPLPGGPYARALPVSPPGSISTSAVLSLSAARASTSLPLTTLVGSASTLPAAGDALLRVH